jgi:hypothetical protein
MPTIIQTALPAITPAQVNTSSVTPAAPAGVTTARANPVSEFYEQYTDTQLLSGLNSIGYSANAIPDEQITRIDAQVRAQYIGANGATVPVQPGSVLAYILGLGGAQAAGTEAGGSDGNVYVMSNGAWLGPNFNTTQGTAGAGNALTPADFYPASGVVNYASIPTAASPASSPTVLLLIGGAALLFFTMRDRH